MSAEENWIKRNARIILEEEPFPEAEFECSKCGYTWGDTEDPRCVCDEPANENEQDPA